MTDAEAARLAAQRVRAALSRPLTAWQSRRQPSGSDASENQLKKSIAQYNNADIASGQLQVKP